MRNAFNMVSRERMLKIVMEDFPEIAKWVFWCYGGKEGTHLWFDKWVLNSLEGVQQGDPLGPLLFSLVIQRIVVQIANECPALHLHKWYLDDGIMGGKLSDVAKALAIISSKGPDLGLFLNLRKCELISWRSLSPSQTALFPPDIIQLVENFDILGVPIGSVNHCMTYVKRKCVSSAFRAIEAIASVDDPQVSSMLLRLCASFSKIVHFLRGVPPVFDNVLLQFDAEVHAGLEKCVGLVVPPSAWQQASLSLSHGGLGLRSARVHASAAYIASVSFASVSDGWDGSQSMGWKEAVTDYNTRVDLSSQLPLTPFSSPWGQHALSLSIENLALNQLLSLSSAWDQARLRGVGLSGASSWLAATPSFGLRQAFTPAEFSFLVRFWLGLDIYPKQVPCPFCSEMMDLKGYHSLTCRTGGHLGVRHNALREVLFLACESACLCPQRETPFLLPNSADRPADVFIPSFSLGQPACFDCAITHTQQPKYIKDASVSGGAAADKYEAEVKDAMYASRCLENGLGFYPMVVEVFGGWGSKSMPVFQYLSKMIASRSGIKKDTAKQRLLERLSVTLQRCNARALLSRIDPSLPLLEDPCPAV